MNLNIIRMILIVGKFPQISTRVFLELEDFDVEAEQFDIEDIQMGMLEAV